MVLAIASQAQLEGFWVKPKAVVDPNNDDWWKIIVDNSSGDKN